MQIRKAISGAAVFVMVMLIPAAVSAQSSSINTFSPYTFYGIGDLQTPGPANIRSMGGAGVAFRDIHLNPFASTFNYLNPASYSSVMPKSFILNFEAEGSNYYLKDGNTQSSYNSFNIKNVGVLFPLARKLGLGFVVTPFSSVGYRLERRMDDPEIVGNIGDVRMKYDGDGDITQMKLGLGMQLFKDFSIGANLVYYMGYIDRIQRIDIRSTTGGEGYTSTYASLSESVSKIMFDFGVQYNIISTQDKVLTLGGTYSSGGKLGAETQYYIPSNDNLGSLVYMSNSINDFSMADIISLGAFYHNHKLSVGADYVFANWGGKNSGIGDEGVNMDMKYTDTHTVKAGLQYTPNRIDTRSFLRRVSYRFGVRYDQNYMAFNGKKINDKVVTLGFGLPMRSGSEVSPNMINLGFELGQRGTTDMGLVKANYFKISLGLNLFGMDYWFMKRKYD